MNENNFKLPIKSCDINRKFTINQYIDSNPSFHMINKIPFEIQATPGSEGQKLRLKLLRNANILFYSAGYPNKRYIYEHTAKRGVKIIIIDEEGSWARNLVEEGIISTFIPLNILEKDTDLLLKQALEKIFNLQNKLKLQNEEINGIITMDEFSTPMVARIAKALSLPGMVPEAVELARNKYETHKCLERANLPGNKYALIKTIDDIDKAAQEVGFPAVLKPISGAGSIAVKRVNSLPDLHQTYEEIITRIKKLVLIDGDVVEGKSETNFKCDSLDEKDAVYGFCYTLILEEYLEGSEIDFDLIVDPKLGVTYTGLHDNGPTQEPWFRETYDIFPSLLSENKQQELTKFLINVCKVIGFNSGLFHIEAKFTEQGPRLIEVNARMAGGPVYKIHKIRYGVDLIDEALFLSLGIPSRPPHDIQYQKCVAVCSVNAIRSGKISDLNFTKKWNSIPGIRVHSNNPLIKEGELIRGPEYCVPSWLTDIIFSCDDVNFGLKMCLKLAQEVVIEYTNNYDIPEKLNEIND